MWPLYPRVRLGLRYRSAMALEFSLLCELEITLESFALRRVVSRPRHYLFCARRRVFGYSGRAGIPSSSPRSMARRSASFRRDSVVTLGGFWPASRPDEILDRTMFARRQKRIRSIRIFARRELRHCLIEPVKDERPLEGYCLVARAYRHRMPHGWRLCDPIELPIKELALSSSVTKPSVRQRTQLRTISLPRVAGSGRNCRV